MLLLAVVGIIGYISSVKGGLDFRFPGYSFNQYAYKQNAEVVEGYGPISKFIESCDFINHMHQKTASDLRATPRIEPVCYESNTLKAHKVLLWGDSFAQMLSYGLIKNLPSSWQLLQVASRGCQASIYATTPSDVNYCQQSNYFALKTIAAVKPEVVVLSQNSTLNQENLDLFSAKLHAMGVQKIIFVDKPPRWNAPLPKLLFRKKVDAHRNKNYTQLDSQTLSQINNEAAFAMNKGAQYINTVQFFCAQDGCLLYTGDTPETSITTLDNEHLTPSASDFFVRTILVKAITND